MPAGSDRVWVENGNLIEVKNAVTMANALMAYDDLTIEVDAEWQLYDENDSGRPATGSYRGRVKSSGAVATATSSLAIPIATRRSRSTASRTA